MIFNKLWKECFKYILSSLKSLQVDCKVLTLKVDNTTAGLQLCH